MRTHLVIGLVAVSRHETRRDLKATADLIRRRARHPGRRINDSHANRKPLKQQPAMRAMRESAKQGFCNGATSPLAYQIVATERRAVLLKQGDVRSCAGTTRAQQSQDHAASGRRLSGSGPRRRLIMPMSNAAPRPSSMQERID